MFQTTTTGGTKMRFICTKHGWDYDTSCPRCHELEVAQLQGLQERGASWPAPPILPSRGGY